MENVRNALAMLRGPYEEPQLFTREDLEQTIEAAIARLERVLQQLEGR